MKAENEKINITLDKEEALEYHGDADNDTISVYRRDWAVIKDRIDANKFDRSKPQAVWARIEAKLRSEAIYGEKWRAPTHMRR